jgi:hypothetical protein
MIYPSRYLWFIDLGSRPLQCGAFAVTVVVWALLSDRRGGRGISEIRAKVLTHTVLGGITLLVFAAVGEYLQGLEGRHSALSDFALNSLTVIIVTAAAVFSLVPPVVPEDDVGRQIRPQNRTVPGQRH